MLENENVEKLGESCKPVKAKTKDKIIIDELKLFKSILSKSIKLDTETKDFLISETLDIVSENMAQLPTRS